MQSDELRINELDEQDNDSIGSQNPKIKKKGKGGKIGRINVK